MYSYFVCVLLLVRDSELATHPYSSDMDTHQLTANSSIAALFLADMSSNNFAFVGKEQVVVSIGHLHSLQNSHRKVREYVNFKKCRC